MPMTLRTYLKVGAFPEVTYADWDKYLKFAPGVNRDDIDPCFIARVAALSRDMKPILGAKWQPVTIIAGYRSYADQVVKYKKTGGYQLPNGDWTGGDGTAAKPGKSFHGFKLAIDVGTPWLKLLNFKEDFDHQTTLRKYGLCKPMTPGNNLGVNENWHIQPSETINMPLADRAKYMPKAA